MLEEIVKALTIFIPTLFKFIIGPIAGYRLGLNLLTTITVTIAASMTSVTAFTFFGEWIRLKLCNRWLSKRKKFTPRTRRVVTIWKKFGLAGLAFLTPILLTPIGGTIAAVSFGARKERIILYMFISSAFFACLFSVLIYSLGESVLPEFLRPK
jgi:hypothetical protein